MAALPVSPLVAQRIFSRPPREVRMCSNIPPRTCIATSLKASVGPWNSSSTRRSPTCTRGTTSRCRNAANALSTMRSMSSRAMSLMNSSKISTANSGNPRPRQPSRRGRRSGIDSGNSSPPSGARPVITASWNGMGDVRPLVLRYRIRRRILAETTLLPHGKYRESEVKKRGARSRPLVVIGGIEISFEQTPGRPRCRSRRCPHRLLRPPPRGGCPW